MLQAGSASRGLWIGGPSREERSMGSEFSVRRAQPGIDGTGVFFNYR